ncbi:hypothetical protein Areg01_32730 [Actinoplanes regularis]|nr:hypothetical protein Areg01_32730 [Actinoplanes regularis]
MPEPARRDSRGEPGQGERADQQADVTQRHVIEVTEQLTSGPGRGRQAATAAGGRPAERQPIPVSHQPLLSTIQMSVPLLFPGHPFGGSACRVTLFRAASQVPPS